MSEPRRAGGLVANNGVGALVNAIGLRGIHQSLDMITMLGFLIMLGTAVNNPILIVEQTRRNLDEHQMLIKDAARKATAIRLCPILMSTATTVFWAYATGIYSRSGTELYRGVGIDGTDAKFSTLFIN